MAKKISQLPSAASLNLSDEFEINQGGVSKKVTASVLAALFGVVYIDAEQVNTLFSGNTFVLAFPPVFVYSLSMNGQVLTNLIDYTISGPTITFTNSWAGPETLRVSYKHV